MSEEKRTSAGFHAPDNPVTWIDLRDWSRRHLFENYYGTDFPYIIMTAEIDVTNPLAFARAHRVSFNLVMVYLCNSVMESIENYRYRFIDGKPFSIGHIKPVVNHLIPGSELFVMGEGPWPCEDILEFCRITHETQMNMTPQGSFERLKGRIDIVNYTSIPWVSYTGFIRTIKENGTDNAPKMSFGKYQKKDGRVMMPVSNQSHHGLMDGYHVGLFYERLQAACDALKI